MEAPKKPRNPFLDIIKGGLIILVVIGHVIQTNFPQFDNNLVFRIIYSFHMPLFMAISGYVAFVAKKDEPILKKLKKRFLTLVVPFLSWYFLYAYFFTEVFKSTNVGDYIKHIVLAPDYGLWFLWILFVCYVVLILVQEYIKFPQTLIKKDYLEYLLFAFAIFLSYCLHVEFLGIGLTKWHLPSFIAGYIVAKNIDRIKKFAKPITEAAFISYPILAFFWYRQKDPSFIKYFIDTLQSNIWILITGFRYLTAAMGSIFFVMALKKITNDKVNRMLEYLGQNTIDIYVIHFNLLGLIAIMSIVNLGSTGLSYIAVVITAIIIIGLSLLISKYIIRQSTLLSTLLLGGTR